MAAPPLSLLGVYRSLRPPTLRDLVFSAKAYLAAVLALMVGFSQNLQNPYWAVLTIYIVLNPPETGAVRSKALFRFFGTIGGGALMVGVTGLFGDQLGVLVTATIGIVAGATFLRQIDRTPTNYVYFSGGVTAGVIGLTNLMQPTNVFDYATARMGEISLGILTIAAVDSLFWPRPMTPEFLTFMTGWRGQARSWLLDALALTAERSSDDQRKLEVRQGLRDLTKAVGLIDVKAVQLPFDVVRSAPRIRHLNLVRRQVAELIGDLAAIETWARAVHERQGLTADLDQSLHKVSAWIAGGSDLPDASTGAHVARGEALIAELEAGYERIDPAAGHGALVERGLLHRLIAFVSNWSALSLALGSVDTGKPLPAHLDQIARRAKPVRSIDYLGAALDVAPMVLSMTVTTLLWYYTAWGSGAGALLFSFIGCVFLIGQGSILQSSVGLLTWILTAFGLVFLYQYAILPRVTDFPVLVAVLGCAMLPFGLMMAMSMSGMLICVYLFSFLGLQNAYAAEFDQSLQTLSSSLVGLFIAIACLYVCSYNRPRFAARRLIGAVRRDIIDLARSPRFPSRETFLFLAVDRLALYFPAAEQLSAGAPIARIGMIDDFAVAINLLTLRGREAHIGPEAGAIVRRLRMRTVDAYRAKVAGRPDDGRLRAAVEAALQDQAIWSEPSHARLLEALTGIQIALKDAPTPPPTEPVH